MKVECLNEQKCLSESLCNRACLVLNISLHVNIAKMIGSYTLITNGLGQWWIRVGFIMYVACLPDFGGNKDKYG